MVMRIRASTTKVIETRDWKEGGTRTRGGMESVGKDTRMGVKNVIINDVVEVLEVKSVGQKSGVEQKDRVREIVDLRLLKN